MKKIISSLLVALPLLLIGCGGSDDDGGGDDGGSVPSYSTVTSASFSPIKAVDSNNQPSALYWEYSVNGGQGFSTSLPIPGESIPITMSFNPMSITIDIGGKTRITSAEGSFSGEFKEIPVTGEIKLLDQDNFHSVADTATTIGESNISFDVSFTSENASIKSTSDIQYSIPTLWYLDREDLDEIGLASHTDSTIASSITTLGSGTPSGDPDQEITNSWKIVGHEATATVNKKTYTNIVLVELTTTSKNLETNELTDPIKITYWVAKGIGMIKAVGFFNALGTKVDVELLDTNLEQVKQ